MEFAIRRMCDDDARAFLEVHHSAVRGINAKDYPPAVIEAWAPLPITEKGVAGVLDNPDNEIRMVAETRSEIVGIGALVLKRNELRACYVAPDAGRRGIGSALVQEIESIARKHGLTFLEVDSSTTAEAFYRSAGYEIRGRAEHILGSGQTMASVKTEKRLVPRRGECVKEL